MQRSFIGLWAQSIALPVAAAVASLAADVTWAANPPAAPDHTSALVRQLGSPVFAERERATRELRSLGISAKDALSAAVNDPDAERRTRARAVLAAVTESDFRDRLDAFSADYNGSRKQSLPGWEQFARLFGGNHQARQLFVEMARQEPELLDAFAQGGKGASEALDGRCRTLLDQFTEVSSREALLPVGTQASLLLVGSADEVAVDEQLGVQLYTWMIYQPTFSKNARSGPWSAIMKKLLGQWIVKDSGTTATMQNLIFAAMYELKPEGLALADKILASETGSPQVRQFALLAIGRFGGKDRLATVEKFLADDTNCGAMQMTNPPRQVDVQVRDAALAVLIHLTTQRAGDYGSVSSQSSPQALFQVPALGFADATQREAGLKRWSEWRAAHPAP